MYLVVFYVGEYVWVCGCVYKIENFRTLSTPSEIASLREAISSSAAFESMKWMKNPTNHVLGPNLRKMVAGVVAEIRIWLIWPFFSLMVFLVILVILSLILV
jgi:hypothetical protein